MPAPLLRPRRLPDAPMAFSRLGVGAVLFGLISLQTLSGCDGYTKTANSAGPTEASSASADKPAEADPYADHHAAALNQSPVKVDRNARVESANITLAMQDLACEGCELMCTEQLTAVKGVKSVKADHKTDTVAVELDPDQPVTFGQLIGAVEGRGFLVESIQQP